MYIIQAGVNGTHIGKLDFRVVKEEGGNRISYIGGDTIRTEGRLMHISIRWSIKYWRYTDCRKS